MTSKTITMVCDTCGRRIETPRADTDPPAAQECHGITCPDCDTGGFDLPAFLDEHGREVSGDPETFNKAPKGDFS